MKSLSRLLSLAVCLGLHSCAATAQTPAAGSAGISIKKTDAGSVLVWVPRVNNRAIGWDADGNLTTLPLGSGGGGGGTWGSITGTLSAQTDLAAALNLRAPLASPTFTGTVTIPPGASIAGYLTEADAEMAFVDFGDLNSFAGTSAITTLGTISAGVWNGTVIPVTHGGTGASSASAARTNLGLVIGTHVLAPNGNGSSLTALNASAISSGTLAAARLPTPTTTTLGGVQRNTGSAGQYVSGIDSSGALIFGTPAGTGGGITALTGDVTGSGSGSVVVTLANTGVSASSYPEGSSFTVDSKGRLTSVFNRADTGNYDTVPRFVDSYGGGGLAHGIEFLYIDDPLGSPVPTTMRLLSGLGDPNREILLPSTSGQLVLTSQLPVAGVDYLAPNGNGISLTNLNASALASGTVATARLGSGTANSSTFLRGDNTWANPLNGLTISSTTGALTITSGKTLTVSNTITLAGTDGSTLNFGAGGTLGTAAYTASSAYQPSASTLTDIAALAPTKGRLIVGNGSNWVDLGVGTDGHALVADSAQAKGLKWDAVGGGGGLTGFTSSLLTSSPNNTVNASVLTASGGSTNQDVVLATKGTGAFITFRPPDGTTTGGNKRGDYAVDLQGPWRSSAADVASGTSSAILFGQYSKANNSYAVAGGYQVTASGQLSTCLGGQLGVSSNFASTSVGGYAAISSGQSSFVGGGESSTASASYSNARGFNALADRYGMTASASGRFSAQGDAQAGLLLARNNTTGSTPTTLFLDGSFTRFTIPAGKVISMQIMIEGARSGGADAYRYTRHLTIKNVSGTTTLIDVVTVGTDYESNAATDVTITADDTTDSLDVKVTNITGENWRSVMRADLVELAY